MDYKNKYIKYKNKYINLKEYINQIGGNSTLKIFVISFNEGEFNSYDDKNNLNELLEIINKNKPDIINIATQEYNNNKNNEGILKNFIKQILGFYYIGNEGMLRNFIKQNLGFHNCDDDKCKKTQIYSSCDKYKELINENTICTKSVTKELIADTISSTFINKETVKLLELNENKLFVDDTNILGYNFKKRLIMTECKVKKNNVENTIYFINAHLPFGSKNDFKYNYRIMNFEKIIREFDLFKKYIDGYPIFISGDLNFRYHFTTSNTLMTNDKSKNQLENIKNYYLTKNGNKEMFELYNYLNKLKSLNEKEVLKKLSKTITDSDKIKEFVDALINSLYMDLPTCKYNDDRNEFVNVTDYKSIKPDQIQFYKKNTEEPRFPSNCDQVIFIMNQNKYAVLNNEINIIDISIKSDHLGIYRQIELKKHTSIV
jgi:hypothetical protein